MSKREKIMLALLALVAALAIAWTIQSCTMPIDIGISAGLEDDCLTLVPECSISGVYSCVDDLGTEDRNCRVACAAGRTMECEADGVFCYQTVGDDEIWVPTVCVSRLSD